MPPPSETVKRRAKPTVPRKPRPLSIGSPYAVKMKVEDKVEPRQDSTHDRTPFSARGGRSHDKQAPQTTPTSAAVHMRPNRTRSAGGQPRPMSLISPDSYEHHMATTGGAPKPTPPRKPAHVKAAAMARKANKSVDSPVPPQTPPQPDSPTADHSVSFAKCKPNNSNNNSSDGIVKQNSLESTVVPSIEPNEAAVSTGAPTATNGATTPCDTPPQTPSGKKEVSEEDYKKMMAEKRRLAREQAEREAEQERQRLLKEQREEEERQRREEEEQRRLEEEQLRLIEIQRRAEEERLQKAMEENRLREEEEAKRRAEEQRLRSEKEEKERRAKHEADQQRRELEERLKRDEAERIARKKKLEAIMSRTRKPPTPTAPRVDSSTPPAHSPNETPEPPVNEHSNHSTPEKSREVAKNHQNLMKNEDLVIITTATPDLVVDADRAMLNNRQNNGSNGGVSGGQTPHNGSHQYNINNNNHIESFSVSGDLLGMGSAANPSLDQLIHINYSTPNTRTDDLNSNNPFANGNGFTNGGAGHKSQEQTAITGKHLYPLPLTPALSPMYTELMTDDLNSNNPFANGNGFTNGGAGHKSQEQTAITGKHSYHLPLTPALSPMYE
ncbi:unnamed protein product [Medioppia subpectinata]|uniref:Uncharacterized protein n=1 Tax=Medioppia subpectinata TaxID=1979941 RepID=A0A7R9L0C5_9ACAR|nr:unnamed protein product [Medioppia subpectinata]CAG2112054.1 unnamed protein product [Medioppia subpectinata]